MRAELPFAGGSARGPNRTLLSLVLGGALLCFANFESGLGVKKWAYRLSGAAMPLSATFLSWLRRRLGWLSNLRP